MLRACLHRALRVELIAPPTPGDKNKTKNTLYGPPLLPPLNLISFQCMAYRVLSQYPFMIQLLMSWWSCDFQTSLYGHNGKKIKNKWQKQQVNRSRWGKQNNHPQPKYASIRLLPSPTVHLHELHLSFCVMFSSACHLSGKDIIYFWRRVGDVRLL